MQDELRVAAGAPGGQSEYRMALASSFLFKHFVATSIELHDMMHAGGGGGGGGEGGVEALPPPPVIAEADRSAARSWVLEPKPTMTASKSMEYDDAPSNAPSIPTDAKVSHMAKLRTAVSINRTRMSQRLRGAPD